MKIAPIYTIGMLLYVITGAKWKRNARDFLQPKLIYYEIGQHIWTRPFYQKVPLIKFQVKSFCSA